MTYGRSIFEFTYIFSSIRHVNLILEEYGRSNIAILSLYLILGKARTCNFEYMVGKENEFGKEKDKL